MNMLNKPIDFSKVEFVVYHLPDGESLTLQVDGLEAFLEFSHGRVCDTSEIDGRIHFYPIGNA